MPPEKILRVSDIPVKDPGEGSPWDVGNSDGSIGNKEFGPKEN